MDCKFIKINDSEYKCEECGFVTRVGNARRNCIKDVGVVQKVVNFIPAVTKHILTGRKTLEESQIQERLKICKECPLYREKEGGKGVCTHSTCGCNLTDTKIFLNKLAWADQSCPLNKWSIQ